MSFHFRPAKREGVQLLIGLAGPSGSGKTLSALRLAAGLAGRKPFAYVDTENGRALHYADDFNFLHVDFDAPFTPARYREVIALAAGQDPPVIVVDSMSHEHAGPGGVLEMHEADLDKRAGGDFKKREALNMSAWIKPKAERKKLINDLLRLRCHLILCFRAEEKTELVDDPEKPGKKKVVPKRILAGHVGWIPVCGKEYPYELTLSLVVTPDKPGVPHAIKIMEQHKPLVPLDSPLSEETGRLLGVWAAGGSLTEGETKSPGDREGSPPAEAPSSQEPSPSVSDPEVAELTGQLLELADALGVRESTEQSITANRAKSEAQGSLDPHKTWLRRSITVAVKRLDERGEGSSLFHEIAEGARRTG